MHHYVNNALALYYQHGIFVKRVYDVQIAHSLIDLHYNRQDCSMKTRMIITSIKAKLNKSDINFSPVIIPTYILYPFVNYLKI